MNRLSAMSGVFLFAIYAIAGCGAENAANENDGGDTDSMDIGTDGDTDSDTDGDTDTDTDSDTDGDTDTDTDGDTDSDTDTDTDSDTDSDTDNDTDTDTDNDTDTDTDTDMDTDTDSDTDVDTDTDSDTDTDNDTDTDTDTNTDIPDVDGGGVACEFECISLRRCENRDGVVRNDMTCPNNDVCCEAEPEDTDLDTAIQIPDDTDTGDCPYMCVGSGWCTSRNGIVHDTFSCDNTDQLCCELDDQTD
jgi:hypothetical protein